jgi:hypothetical protein
LITETRQIFYYNKYQFRAKINNSELSSTRNITTIAEFTKRKHHFYSYGIGIAKPRILSDSELESIDKYLTWVNKNSESVTIRVQRNGVSVFSNDLSLLKTLSNIYPSTEFSQADLIANPVAGIKYFVNQPKYQHRVMVKNIKIKSETLSDIQDLFARYDDTVMRPSKSFTKWLNRVNRVGWYPLNTQFYIYGSFYIDYNDPSVLTLMHLTLSDIFGKSYKLEKRPTQ